MLHMNTEKNIHEAIATKKNLEKKLKANLGETLKFVQDIKSKLYPALTPIEKTALDDLIDILVIMNMQDPSINLINSTCQRILNDGTDQATLEKIFAISSKTENDYQALKNFINKSLELVQELIKTDKLIEAQHKEWLEKQKNPVKNEIAEVVAPTPATTVIPQVPAATPAPTVIPQVPAARPAAKENISSEFLAEQVAIAESFKTKPAANQNTTPPRVAAARPTSITPRTSQNDTSTYSNPSVRRNHNGSRAAALIVGIPLALLVLGTIGIALLLSFGSLLSIASIVTGLTKATVLLASTSILFGLAAISSIGAVSTRRSTSTYTPTPYVPAPRSSTVSIATRFDTTPTPCVSLSATRGTTPTLMVEKFQPRTTFWQAPVKIAPIYPEIGVSRISVRC